MIRRLAFSTLYLLIVVSCAAPGPEVSTPVPVLESPQPTPLPEKADIGDGGLLSGLPCEAPCVYGIRIGETALDQVMPILQQNGLSPCYREDNLSWIGITCGYSVVVQVDSGTRIVNATGLYPSVPISLGQVIEKYGEPDYVFLLADGTPEAPTSRISLYWDSLRMTVEMPAIDSQVYALDERTTAEMVLFFDEEHYIDSNEISFGEFYRRWNGYGPYQPGSR